MISPEPAETGAGTFSVFQGVFSRKPQLEPLLYLKHYGCVKAVLDGVIEGQRASTKVIQRVASVHPNKSRHAVKRDGYFVKRGCLTDPGSSTDRL